MTFGEALRHELIQIPQLSQKVFPIVAPEGVKSPFLVYKREEAEGKKTLSGTSNKVHATYELILVTGDYAEKEAIEELIKLRVLSFYGRNIGENGPFIQNETFKLLGEAYSLEADSFTSQMRLEADY